MLHRTMNTYFNEIIIYLLSMLVCAPFACAPTFKEIHNGVMLTSNSIVRPTVPAGP